NVCGFDFLSRSQQVSDSPAGLSASGQLGARWQENPLRPGRGQRAAPAGDRGVEEADPGRKTAAQARARSAARVTRSKLLRAGRIMSKMWKHKEADDRRRHGDDQQQDPLDPIVARLLLFPTEVDKGSLRRFNGRR